MSLSVTMQCSLVVTEPELARRAAGDDGVEDRDRMEERIRIVHDEEDPPPVTRCFTSKRDLDRTARTQAALLAEHRVEQQGWDDVQLSWLGDRAAPS